MVNIVRNGCEYTMSWEGANWFITYKKIGDRWYFLDDNGKWAPSASPQTISLLNDFVDPLEAHESFY